MRVLLQEKELKAYNCPNCCGELTMPRFEVERKIIANLRKDPAFLIELCRNCSPPKNSPDS
jgi:hypothetical protein